MNGALQPVLSYVRSTGWLGRTVIVAGLVLLTEPTYELYKIVRKKFGQRMSKDHICEVHFINRRKIGKPVPSPIDRDCEHVLRLISYIDRAEKSICLSMYIFTMPSVAEAIVRAKKERGVIVRVVTCQSMMFNANAQFRCMLDADIPIRYTLGDEYIMHHKYCLLDPTWLCANCLVKNHIKQYGEPDKNEEHTMFYKAILDDMPTLLKLFGDSCSRCDRKKVSAPKAKKNKNPLPSNGVLITGSCNWTNVGLMFNRENIMFTSLPNLVDSFTTEFQRSWYEMGDILKPTQLSHPNREIDDRSSVH